MAVARVLSFFNILKNNAKITEIKYDRGGSNNKTAAQFSCCGDDSIPLKNDYLIFVKTQKTGGSAVVGYLDPKNSQKSTIGEKRIYSRSSSGDEVAEIWLKNDGSILFNNQNGSIKLEASGEVNINGVLITTSGQIITANGVNLDTHQHDQSPDSAGDTQQRTGGAV